MCTCLNGHNTAELALLLCSIVLNCGTQRICVVRPGSIWESPIIYDEDEWRKAISTQPACNLSFPVWCRSGSPIRQIIRLQVLTRAPIMRKSVRPPACSLSCPGTLESGLCESFFPARHCVTYLAHPRERLHTHLVGGYMGEMVYH